jgi:hypothetical protein
MTIDKTTGGPRAVAASLARSPAFAARLSEIAAEAGFRAYRTPPGMDRARAARRALSAFFRTGDPSAAEAEAARCLPHCVHDAGAEAAAIAGSGRLANLELLLVDAAGGLRIDEDTVVAELTAALAACLREQDPSSPLDLVSGERVVVCCVPGHGAAGTVSATLSSHVGEQSSVATLVPDECVARLLHAANVSTAEFLEAARERTGTDPSDPPHPDAYPEGSSDPAFLSDRARAASWADLAVEHDPSRPSLLSAGEIVDGVEGAPYGFNAMVSFSADAAALVSRDWDSTMEVTGGLLGLHDLVNGSGDPRRFESPAFLDSAPSDFVVGEGWECGLPEVHGLTEAAFSSTFRDVPAPSATRIFEAP